MVLAMLALSRLDSCIVEAPPLKMSFCTHIPKHHYHNVFNNLTIEA
jgi:hypothetical protein